MKIYLAGPMTGIKDHNFPAFFAKAKELRDMNYEVVNPAELDANEVTTHPWDYYMRRDLKKLVDCDVIALLPGWENSKGALLEIHVAKALGMDVLDADTLDTYTEPKEQTVTQEAQKLVMGDRGQAYGHPISDFARTGRIWGAILGTPDVSPDKVAMCMVGVKLSREVNKPKRDNRVDGAGYFLCLDMVRQEQERNNAIH